MNFQNNSLIGNDNTLKNILNLERKYFDLIFNIISSQSFKEDLLSIENEIQDRYQDFEMVWKLKNKFDIPAERLVAHHIYRNESLSNLITGMYTSAISSDIGIVLSDAILSIDVKTNDLIGNKSDYNNITAEKNQISFDNSNYNLIPTKSNLDSLSRYRPHLPILTYVVKIGYSDDGHSFDLIKSDVNFPTIQFANIPNGRLSKLFNFNILNGFKTYTYSKEPDKTIYLDSNSREDAISVMEQNANYHRLEDESRITYRNINNGDIWVQTTYDKKPMMRVLTGGNTARVNTNVLKERLDGNNLVWSGLKSIIY